jgi:F-type H+-transporting ATPase subunit gamma
METLENLRSKSEGARDLKSVVRTMKAMAASNIVQFEMAVAALGDYYHTVALGITAYLHEQKIDTIDEGRRVHGKNEKPICAIVFGSDQGLVGQFNDSIADFTGQSLNALPGKKELWVVGERVQLLLLDAGFSVTKLFPVPGSVKGITPLINELLIKSEENREQNKMDEVYVFHNQPGSGAGYLPVMQRLLPFDEQWRQGFAKLHWPTKNPPQIAGGVRATLLALIREYLFVSLFKACAESLASENASRLDAMQRAEKNIEELLDDLSHEFHRLRQGSIDEELFDVIAGFEALK